MSIFKKIVNWLEYGSAKPVIDFGEIYSGVVGKERFTAGAKLLAAEEQWALRLDLKRHWSSQVTRTIVDCHFKARSELKEPFALLLRDVENGVHTPKSVTVNAASRVLVGLTAGEIVRGYGRIDYHPKDEGRFRSELFLSRQNERYWLILSLGEGTVEWSKWPVPLGEAVLKLLEKSWRVQ
ncbi:MAG: hypothetical protein QNJ45_08810 [Ardenticatenaceae bacterium]|nr:hypothetical protein [Ardenticatenaceae bacterium]